MEQVKITDDNIRSEIILFVGRCEYNNSNQHDNINF